MEYYEIIEKLYKGNFTDVLSVLNKSIYVKDYASKGINLTIHTGFSFYTHKNKKMSLLYDFVTKKIIRLVQSKSIPQIQGLIVYYNKNKKYYYATEYVISNFDFNTINYALIFPSFEKLNLFFKIYTTVKGENTISVKEIYNIDYIRNVDKIISTLYIKSNNNKYKQNIDKITVCESEKTTGYLLSKIIDRKIFFDSNTHSIYDENYSNSKDISNNDFDNEYNNKYEEYDDIYYEYDNTYDEYSGSWAQGIEGLSDDFIEDALGGEPDAYWNID